MPGLIGIGVGPGDVELLTVKAVKAIQNADIIMCPASNEKIDLVLRYLLFHPLLINQKIKKLLN